MFRFHRGQKRASASPELEFQAVVSCYVGRENQIYVRWKSSQCSYPQATAPSPVFVFITVTESWTKPL